MTDVVNPVTAAPATAPTVEDLQAQLSALQAAHEAVNPTPVAKTDLVTRFNELKAAGIHVGERVRVLADEGYGKVSSVEGILLELVDEIASKVL
jgi:hypothetical protein